MSDARILPERFMTAYEVLHMKALRDGTGGENHPLSGRSGELGKAEGKPTGQWPVKSNEITSIGKNAGPQQKTVGKTSNFMGNERAWTEKRKIDKRLRKMAKEMFSIVSDLENGGSGKVSIGDVHRKCSGKCGRFCDKDANFCSNCGGRTIEVD